MGNKGTSEMIGSGRICIETSMEVNLILKEVRHVPDLCMNILSTGVLDNEGYTSVFTKRDESLQKHLWWQQATKVHTILHDRVS